MSMPYKYLDDIATADVAFEAWDQDLNGMFVASFDAVTNILISDLSSIEVEEEVTIELEDVSLDMLLFQFLQELVFVKDAKNFVARVKSVNIEEKEGAFFLKAVIGGQLIDRLRHNVLTDIKAITLHNLKVEKNKDRYSSIVVVDV